MGKLASVSPGAAGTEVKAQSADGLEVLAVFTQNTVEEKGTIAGAPVTALVKASVVMLATVL